MFAEDRHYEKLWICTFQRSTSNLKWQHIPVTQMSHIQTYCEFSNEKSLLCWNHRSSSWSKCWRYCLVKHITSCYVQCSQGIVSEKNHPRHLAIKQCLTFTMSSLVLYESSTATIYCCIGLWSIRLRITLETGITQKIKHSTDNEQ